MARARSIKPAFFTNEDLVELPFEFRLLFIGLWLLADREGRLEDRPKRIKMAIFPADNVDVDTGLNALQEMGFVLRYKALEINIIQITSFEKHQNPHIKESASKLPPPSDEHCASTVQAPDKHGASPADSLTPYSLTPYSLTPDSVVNQPTVEKDTEVVNHTVDQNSTKNSKIKKTESPSSDGLTRVIKPLPSNKNGFDQFWEAYPRKVGKDRARKAWIRLAEPHNTLKEILETLVWQKKSDQWLKNNGQYIPNPATYLNEGRWKDEKPAEEITKPGISKLHRRNLDALKDWVPPEMRSKK